MEGIGFRAVLFDLDGTLLDTLTDLADSVNAALEVIGCPTHPVESYRAFIGSGARTLVARALPPDRRDDETVNRCLRIFHDDYRRRWRATTRPYPGIPELLDALVARGLRMAVFSNKPHEFTVLCVKEMLDRWHFDAVMGQRDGTPLKPDPTVALEIAGRLGIESREFVYLGDSATDMQTARAAGMFPVGALWGFRTAEELRTGGAALLIAKPLELLDLLDRAVADTHGEAPRSNRSGSRGS